MPTNYRLLSTVSRIPVAAAVMHDQSCLSGPRPFATNFKLSICQQFFSAITVPRALDVTKYVKMLESECNQYLMPPLM